MLFIAYIFLYVPFLFTHTLENYTLYEITAFNAYERAFLYYLHLKKEAISFLNGVSNEAAIPMDVMVTEEKALIFEEKMQSFNIQYNIITDVQIASMPNENDTSPYNVFNTFYDWENILNLINKYGKKNSNFKKTVIAKTFEKRDIFLLHLSNGKRKPIVFIVGGEDGKDWMSSALILNLLSELLNRTSGLNSLLSKFDFYLLPILNPDGFVYSKRQDRLWSKNRRDIYPQKKCHHGNFPIGVNIARNWFFEKSSKMIDEECNAIYIGHKALSEEESQALSYVLNSLALDMIAFINVKGFGRYITVPFGHTTSLANNHDIMMEILRSTCSKVLENHNITYYVGTTANYFYNFSGNMADWVKFKLNTPVVYTVYLEDENTVLPLPSQINPLKAQFFTILNESMFISQDIYGPLFNNEVNTFSYFYSILVYNIYMFNGLLNIYCLKTPSV